MVGWATEQQTVELHGQKSAAAVKPSPRVGKELAVQRRGHAISHPKCASSPPVGGLTARKPLSYQLTQSS